jgi:hypothetical protein
VVIGSHHEEAVLYRDSDNQLQMTRDRMPSALVEVNRPPVAAITVCIV